MRHKIWYVYFFAFFSYLSATQSIIRTESGTLYENSRYWPYHTKLLDDLLQDNGTKIIKKGQRGVVIRLESDDLVIVDFGRFGIHKLEVDKTTIPEDVALVQSGQRKKDDGNYIRMIGPRMNDPKIEPVGQFPYSKIIEYKSFLLFYTDLSGSQIDLILKIVEPIDAFCESKKVLPHIIPVEYPKSPEADLEIAEVLRDSELLIPVMPNFLSDAYRYSFQHDVADGSKLVAVYLDPGGKVLGRWDVQSESDVDKVTVKVQNMIQGLSDDLL